MPTVCPECDRPVAPVAAPTVTNSDVSTDHQIGAYELDGWDASDTAGDFQLSVVVYFCPICRYVFFTEEPDQSWAWISWDGIPVVVSKPTSATLGID